MKVLIIYHAGAMQNARQIYQALSKTSDVELTVIVPQRLPTERVYDPSGWLCVEQEENSEGYCLIPVALRDQYKQSKGFEIRRLQSVIKQIRPDIIHVLDEATSNCLIQIVWQKLLASPRSRVLFYGYENLPIRPSWRSSIWKLTWAQMAGGAAANSEALANLRRAGFPKNLPLERIFWGVSTDTFKSMHGLALKEELGLDYEYAVGFVGRFLPQKGLRVLRQAMHVLPSSLHFLIIGNGPMRAELESWSDQPDLRGRIHLYDVMPSKTLAKYINCMNVLVVPSLTLPHWKEQYGRVIAETMACGVPVIGSDSGAIPEVIGPAGLIVPECNPQALAEAVHTAVFDRAARERFRQHGLQRAHQELSVKAMAKRLSDFYHRVLES
jgi:glycosyltransferase involved in cell wall biosynthesis